MGNSWFDDYVINQEKIEAFIKYSIKLPVIVDNFNVDDEPMHASDVLTREKRQLEGVLAERGREREIRTLNPAFDRFVGEFDLSGRSANFFRHAGIRYVGELVQWKEDDLLKIKNFGRKSLKELKGVILDPLGLTFGMVIPDWTRPDGGQTARFDSTRRR